MPEIEQEVKTVRVNYVCDACQSGNMVAGNIVLTSSPPQFPHTCDQCGASRTFVGFKYPYLKYVAADQSSANP